MEEADLVFRLDAPAQPARLTAIDRLIGDEFDLDLAPLDRLGRDPGYVSFGWWDGGAIVAHVGLQPIVLHRGGAAVPAFGLGLATVHPARRGRGLFRDLMERALAFADARVDLVLLETEEPELYRRFGFAEVAEHSFLGPLEVAAGPGEGRCLRLDVAADVAILADLFARRTPPSLVGGLDEHPMRFFLKALESPEIELVRLPSLDAVAAIEPGVAGELVLLDVVAPAIPPLAAIATALGGGFDRAHVFVTPDRLGWVPETVVAEATGLMARGRFPADPRPFGLSPMHV